MMLSRLARLPRYAWLKLRLAGLKARFAFVNWRLRRSLGKPLSATQLLREEHRVADLINLHHKICDIRALRASQALCANQKD